MIGNKIVVYTSGTFDMLHANHIKMIEYARSLGDILIVGVNTDELVMSYKSQPIIPFEERIALIKALKYPDIVIPQHSLNHEDKVKKLNFDVFVVGDDWVGKYDYLKEQGVTVVYFPYGQGISSTELKNRIYERWLPLKETADSHFSADVEVKSKKKEKHESSIKANKTTTVSGGGGKSRATFFYKKYASRIRRNTLFFKRGCIYFKCGITGGIK